MDLSALPVVHTIGSMQFDPIWAERMHLSHHAEILFLVEGQMTLQLSETSIPASQGDVLVVPPETMHQDRFDLNRPPVIFYCSFEWAGFQPFFDVVENSQLSQLGSANRRELGTLFQALRRGLSGQQPMDQLITQSRLHTILLLLYRACAHADNAPPSRLEESTGSRLVKRALDYLEDHYHECITLDDIACDLSVSSYHLSHVFSKERDFSLFSYLTNLRIAKAKELLKHTGKPVGEIARATGYESSNYFSKVFKKHTGCSPSQYRR